MALLLGIDLSPARCRVIELEPRARRGGRSDARVVSFASLAPDDPAARAARESLRGRLAAVVVWGARSDHRQAIVTSGTYDSMRREARARLRDAGFTLQGTLSDIAPVRPRPSTPSARPGRAGTGQETVLLASASAAELSAALAPLVSAGVRIQSVLTPAAALQALASVRQGPAHGLEAYVALAETATCIAVMRDGALVAAHDFQWGYLDDASEGEVRPRDDIARRLAEEIQASAAACRERGAPLLTQVSVCGGLPDLRSMTIPLMEQLDVEVEALDSLAGIDQESLPEPSGEFRERIAELRLAWAAAAVGHPALDLYRDGRRRVVRTRLSRVAMMGGAAAGLGIGWLVQGQWPPVEPPVTLVAVSDVVATPRMVPPPVIAPRVPAPAARPAGAPVATAFRMPVPAPEPLAPAPAAPRRAPAAPAAGGPPPIAVDLGTILYGPDRQLAIVNGRIVQAGDDVSGARVVEITPGAVVLRDADGRTRRVSLGASGP